ncbi:MAG TPA: CHASE3 domain-containing protein, partial [Flavisolibacter sp.]|nr:CHASE3 domain-containing protein [Flavisolibacter sp.]
MKNTLTNSRFRRFSFEKKILAYLLAICLVISSIVFLYVKVSKQSRINNYWVQHTEEVLAHMDTVVSLHKDIALTTKGYIITGDTSFLASHDRKFTSIAASVQKLRSLTRDNSLLQRRMDTLQTMLTEYHSVREKSIAFRSRNTFRLEDEVPLVYASEKTSNQLQALFQTIQQDERDRLAERRATFLQNARNLVFYIRVLLLVFVVSFLAAVVIVYRNSRKRSRAESALLKSEALTRSIITHAPVLVNVKDLAGRFMLANNQFAVTMQVQKEELIGKNSHDILPPETADVMRHADEEVKQQLEPVDLQVDFPAADGMQRFIATKFPLFDEKGKLYAIGSMFMDITPVKRAHEALQQSYQQQQRILNGLQQALSASSD